MYNALALRLNAGIVTVWVFVPNSNSLKKLFETTTCASLVGET